MRLILACVMFSVAATASAQEVPPIPATFEWPEPDSNAIPDLRIGDDIRSAREAAREATTRASDGRSAAAAAKRRASVQGVFGVEPQRATVDDETEVAVARGSSLGTVSYPSGATLLGALDAGVGVYTAAPESPLSQFSGWVFGASTQAPRPLDGIFEWKNGDIFTGSITGDGSSSRGIYVKADRQVRFVGIVDLSEIEFRPVRGHLETTSGKLLAVVRRD